MGAEVVLMKNLAEVDSNFKIETKLEKEGIKFYDIKKSPFKIYGVFPGGEKFCRLPENVARKVSEGVLYLHANTAGGRVRFKTDSPYIAILAKMNTDGIMPHFAFSGSAGFDMYEKTSNGENYIKTFMPPIEMRQGYESIVELGEKKLREITINFPLYSEVSELYVGLDENAAVMEASPYINEKPLVYYGSSITQGGCASRPGNSYQAIISRRFNLDYINLGFSGSAKGEDEMTYYISSLEMSMFIYDYDYNAPSAEHLRTTHEKLFKAVRAAHPDIPIIIMSRPSYLFTPLVKERYEIIERTYKNAVSSGDKNVYLLNGETLMSLCKNDGTVDGCHPNDFGFASMAQAVGDVIEKILSCN